jgi:hypothetical protein
MAMTLQYISNGFSHKHMERETCSSVSVKIFFQSILILVNNKHWPTVEREKC